jgi:hypothetical protein
MHLDTDSADFAAVGDVDQVGTLLLPMASCCLRVRYSLSLFLRQYAQRTIRHSAPSRPRARGRSGPVAPGVPGRAEV